LVSAPDTTGASRREQKFFGSFFQKRTAAFALWLLWRSGREIAALKVSKEAALF
jgi:hypothetical protein